MKAKKDNPKQAELYIYSDIEGDGYNFWTGETVQSETSAKSFQQKMEAMGDVEEICVYINSMGGSVVEGTAIYNQLRRHKAKKTVYIDGFACSVASVIAMAGDTVIMPKNTLMMIHDAWTYACGNARELRKQADDLETINNAAKRAYLLKAGEKLEAENLTAMMERETYLTAEQCVELGLADQIAEETAESIAAERLEEIQQRAKAEGVRAYEARAAKICALVRGRKQEEEKQQEAFAENAIAMLRNMMNMEEKE